MARKPGSLHFSPLISGSHRLGWNGIGGQGALYFATALRTNTTLTRLNLVSYLVFCITFGTMLCISTRLGTDVARADVQTLNPLP
eukprot:2071532-Rhodomonas_salina.1